MKKMWKVDRNFLEKAEEEDFCFVEGGESGWI